MIRLAWPLLPRPVVRRMPRWLWCWYACEHPLPVTRNMWRDNRMCMIQHDAIGVANAIVPLGRPDDESRDRIMQHASIFDSCCLAAETKYGVEGHWT